MCVYTHTCICIIISVFILPFFSGSCQGQAESLGFTSNIYLSYFILALFKWPEIIFWYIFIIYTNILNIFIIYTYIYIIYLYYIF